MTFKNSFIRMIAGCTLLTCVTSAVGPAVDTTIRKTIDMMGAVESAQVENNAGGYGGRKVYSINNEEEKKIFLLQHFGSSFSYVAAAGPSVVISAGPHSRTIYYSVPAGGVSISRGSPGASYVVSTYPGVISSFPSSMGAAATRIQTHNNINVNADPAVQAVSISVDPSHSLFSSSSSPSSPSPSPSSYLSSGNPSTKQNNYSSYSGLNPVVSISTGALDSSSIINLGSGDPIAGAVSGYYGYPALAAAQRNLQGASQLISRIASSLRF